MREKKKKGLQELMKRREQIIEGNGKEEIQTNNLFPF